MLRTLVANTTAAALYEDPRTVDELLFDASADDRSAEAALYVRFAADLDRVAARAVGSSAMDQDDLHQEGAIRLIADARSCKIGADFGGNVAAYLRRAVFTHLLNIASTQSSGKPTDPTRLTQKLRQALRATSRPDGEYDLIAAAAYARTKHGWSLATFWEVHNTMFAGAVDLYQWNGHDRRNLADTIGDPAAEDPLARIEVVQTVRALLASDVLARREREVVCAVFGLDGPALSDTEAAIVLGISRQSVNKSKRVALSKLASLAQN
ncbi:hypothetical protein [Actinosynnema sp. NPDC020468]|uniref:hypothetical protein n=1 Tax=Actinosynnema sp. NPDC020468 TaxID=3154488 RepID=UPI0033E25131